MGVFFVGGITVTTFAFWPQGFWFDFEFDDPTNVILVWPLIPEAANWLHLIVEALGWSDRALWLNGALVVRQHSEDWNALFMDIYKAGWNWTAVRTETDRLTTKGSRA